VLFLPKNHQNAFSAGCLHAPPHSLLGKLTTLPWTP